MACISLQSKLVGWLVEILFWVGFLSLSCTQVHAQQFHMHVKVLWFITAFLSRQKQLKKGLRN